jgi:hypothetical protein
VASKSAQSEPEKAGLIEELLDHCDTTLDRVKTLYEQYFLGIQKQPPSHLHTDVERKLRELQQIQIRNTAMRYRFATIQQKLGSYNNYWRRTLRQIENGTYHRNLAKIGRKAAASGEEIPEEILAAMPKRMQEQVKRDREAALARQRRRDGTAGEGADVEMEFDDEDATGVKPAPAAVKKTSSGAHVVEEDGDFDLDAYFAAVTTDDAAPAASISQPSMPAARSRPAMPAFTDERTNPEARPFDDDEDADAERSYVIVSRPAPPSVPPPVHNPALRAAGLRTPPLGIPRVTSPVPVTPRPQQPAAPRPQPISPALRESQAIATTAIPTMRDPRIPVSKDTGVIPTTAIPTMRDPRIPVSKDTGVIPTTAIPTVRTPPAGLPSIPSPGLPSIPSPGLPSIPSPGPARPMAQSQVVRPLPVMPGSASHRAPVPVETLSGPFPRAATAPIAPPAPKPTQAIPRPPPPPPGATQAIPKSGQTQPLPRQAMPKPRPTTEPDVEAPRQKPPPGMTDADVNALYAKYVKAKEAVGEKTGPGAYGKLLQTINAQAPKIMEQYKAKGVDFQVVVKDNQVVIRAKPKP